ncbi:MAG TPA: DsrE family protein [Caulobacteraceae bacterium]|nr:DsrE family protein [Caulobacteraceae bacterium]
MRQLFSRRGAFAGLATVASFAGLGGPALSAAPAGYYRDQKVVYQNNGGPPDDATFFSHLLGHLRAHFAAVGATHLEIRVVDFGNGVDAFSLAQTDKALAGQMDEMRAQGVRFLMCANTLRFRKIDWRALYGVKEDDIVPAGVAELARLQGMGFAYIRV